MRGCKKLNYQISESAIRLEEETIDLADIIEDSEDEIIVKQRKKGLSQHKRKQRDVDPNSDVDADKKVVTPKPTEFQQLLAAISVSNSLSNEISTTSVNLNNMNNIDYMSMQLQLAQEQNKTLQLQIDLKKLNDNK